jgi:hypothetical protein
MVRDAREHITLLLRMHLFNEGVSRVTGRRNAFILAALVSTLALAARAAPASPDSPASQPAYTFAKGTWTLQLYGAYAGGMGEYTDVASMSGGASYYVFDNISLGLEANGYGAFQSGQHGVGRDAWMYGLSGVLRHHVLRFERTTFFIDASFGPAQANHRVPAEGTYFNFVTRTGLGATYHLKDNMYLMGGVRYFHLSNARIEGSERNPSINGIEGYAGVMWKF